MAPPIVRKTQEECFYSEGWTAAMERKVIRELLQLQKIKYWVVGELNAYDVTIVRKTINEEFQIRMNDAIICEKISFLKDRYYAFKVIKMMFASNGTKRQIS